MEDLIIAVNRIEECQTLNDTASLDNIFEKAKKTLVGGGKLILVRIQPSGESYPFEEYSDLDDLMAYKKNVYKYLH